MLKYARRAMRWPLPLSTRVPPGSSLRGSTTPPAPAATAYGLRTVPLIVGPVGEYGTGNVLTGQLNQRRML